MKALESGHPVAAIKASSGGASQRDSCDARDWLVGSVNHSGIGGFEVHGYRAKIALDEVGGDDGGNNNGNNNNNNDDDDDDKASKGAQTTIMVLLLEPFSGEEQRSASSFSHPRTDEAEDDEVYMTGSLKGKKQANTKKKLRNEVPPWIRDGPPTRWPVARTTATTTSLSNACPRRPSQLRKACVRRLQGSRSGGGRRHGGSTARTGSDW